MKVYPLTQPLSRLPPDGRVYIVREALVFLYPASIVAEDALGERYAALADDRWDAAAGDWQVGRCLAQDVALNGAVPPMRCARARDLTREVWRREGLASLSAWAVGRDETFALWWSGLRGGADPCMTGAAARVAARELMTFSLFRHRHLCDAVDDMCTPA